MASDFVKIPSVIVVLFFFLLSGASCSNDQSPTNTCGPNTEDISPEERDIREYYARGSYEKQIAEAATIELLCVINKNANRQLTDVEVRALKWLVSESHLTFYPDDPPVAVATNFYFVTNAGDRWCIRYDGVYPKKGDSKLRYAVEGVDFGTPAPGDRRSSSHVEEAIRMLVEKYEASTGERAGD